MKSLSSIQYACLEAMGIDVWVSRESDSVIEASDAVAATDSTEQSSVLNVVKEASAVAPITTTVSWDSLSQAVTSCQQCALHTSRAHTVFGEGNKNADWLIIGDVPSEEENKLGLPFKGEQGDLLTAMLKAIGLARQQVYVTNIIKCKTPNQRDAEQSEIELCNKYLKQQISLLKPKIILALGKNAAQNLLNNHSTLARLRQKIHTLEDFNIPVIVTHHPASLLSMPTNKRDAWHDLLFAKKTISTEDVL